MNQNDLNLPALARAKDYIYAIDFSMIIEKMVMQDGWCKVDAEETCRLYRNFLYLNRKYANGNLLPPSIDVDEFWHYHILDTKKYAEDCANIFGYYLHHYPYLILDHQLDQSGLTQAFSLTQKLHQEEFGELIFATRSRYTPLVYKLLKLMKI